MKDVERLQDFMEQFNFATPVTQRDGEHTASHLPVVVDRAVIPNGASYTLMEFRKFKLNQNRTAADRAGVIGKLSASDDAAERAAAGLMT